MSDEIYGDYAQLIEEIMFLAAERAKALGHSLNLSRQRVSQAVKPPDWAPKDKQDWNRHLELKDTDGKRQGFVDTEDELVQEFRDHSPEAEPSQQVEEPIKGPDQSRLLSLAGTKWVSGTYPPSRDVLGEAEEISDEEAHGWLSDRGWQVVSSETDPSSLDPGSATLINGADVVVPDTVPEAVVRNGRVQTSPQTETKVDGVAEVNGQVVSGWDSIAEDAAQPVHGTGASREEQRLIDVGAEPAGHRGQEADVSH